MNKKIIIIFIILIIVSSSTIIGISYLSHSKTNTISIGAILPLTGNNSYTGQDWKDGLDLAINEINKNSKIKLNIIYEDSQGDPKIAINAYNKLRFINKTNLFVTTISGVTLSLAPLAEKEKTPLFTISVSPSILNSGEYTFVNNFNANQELPFLINYINKYKNYKTLAILSQDNESGQQYNTILEKLWQDNNKIIVVNEKFNKDDKDYSTIVSKIKDTNPDFIYIVGYSPQITQILISIRNQNIDIPIYSYFDALDNTLINQASKAAEGFTVTSSNFSKDISKNFFEKFNNKYNKDPNYKNGLAYDIAMIYFYVLQKCDFKDYNTYCIKNEIYNIKDFPGVTGETTINSDGGTNKELAIWQVQNGKFIKVEN